MIIEQNTRHYVAVIGAGPAGLFAARELAAKGIYTVLLNRDIKPGGLAEYGIYPSKTKMKEGLRNQFRNILNMPDLEYYGNVLVGEHADFSLADLQNMGFQALLVTVGAQSTKQLGIPGEELPGVYHAKDIVYHYNVLPPFSEVTYQIGKRVAVIGVGNVMMDVTRWLVEFKQVDQVVAVARRGPAEVKFDRKELESIVRYLDLDALDDELERVSPLMHAVNQDPQVFRDMIRTVVQKTQPVDRGCCFQLRFLSSPVRILGDDNGVTGLEVENNMLVLSDDGESRAHGTGQHATLDVDTVIFAIGDVVDSAIGLPVQYGEFAKNPQPRFPVEGISYEAFDPRDGKALPDIFLAGWARRPSTGLVGVARKDATNAAQAIVEYLQTVAPTALPVGDIFRERLLRLEHPVVDCGALQRLEVIERDRARELNRETYKFSSNREMLELLGLVPARK